MNEATRVFWVFLCEIIKPVTAKTSGERRSEGRQRAALLSDPRNYLKQGVSETVGSPDEVWYISLSRHQLDQLFREAIGMDSIIKAEVCAGT